jgi:hypothetical protein
MEVQGLGPAVIGNFGYRVTSGEQQLLELPQSRGAWQAAGGSYDRDRVFGGFDSVVLSGQGPSLQVESFKLRPLQAVASILSPVSHGREAGAKELKLCLLRFGNDHQMAHWYFRPTCLYCRLDVMSHQNAVILWY